MKVMSVCRVAQPWQKTNTFFYPYSPAYSKHDIQTNFWYVNYAEVKFFLATAVNKLSFVICTERPCPSGTPVIIISLLDFPNNCANEEKRQEAGEEDDE